MISIIITTKDQVSSVAGCIRSVLDQSYDGDREILVIDDGSRDRTVETVMEQFAEKVTVISKPALGWFDSLRRALENARGDLLVFFDPHCIAKNSEWLSTIASCFESDPELIILTGSLYKADDFMGKVSALTFQRNFLSQRRKWVHHLEDDHFAIRRDILKRLLDRMPVHELVGDTAGGVVLGAEIERQGLSVLYEPRISVFHESPDFLDYFLRCTNYSAPSSVMARRLDPAIRGAAWLKYPFLASAGFGVVKFFQDIKAIFHFRRLLRIRLWEIPPLLTVAAIGKICYAWGIWRVLRSIGSGNRLYFNSEVEKKLNTELRYPKSEVCDR